MYYMYVYYSMVMVIRSNATFFCRAWGSTTHFLNELK